MHVFTFSGLRIGPPLFGEKRESQCGNTTTLHNGFAMMFIRPGHDFDLICAAQNVDPTSQATEAYIAAMLALITAFVWMNLSLTSPVQASQKEPFSLPANHPRRRFSDRRQRSSPIDRRIQVPSSCFFLVLISWATLLSFGQRACIIMPFMIHTQQSKRGPLGHPCF